MHFEKLDWGIEKSDLSEEEKIVLAKLTSKLTKTAKKNNTEQKCFFCGKEVSSFCNSHFIPRFCLENIAKDGSVFTPNIILNLPIMGASIGKEQLGINNSGTFQIICRECDSIIFQEYENPENYSKMITQKMMSEIAIKNLLKYISKRKFELALYVNAKMKM